ncbi:MAG: haloacid dehalogenase-like hydrolase [Hyphomonadaceae bacterium]
MNEANLPPLVVDLDGTLVMAETSLISARLAFRDKPLAALAAAFALLDGRAAAKRAFARLARPKPRGLPYHPGVQSFLAKERLRGRTLHLATGADDAIAQEVAAYVGVFDSAQGSDGRINLKGAAKLAWIDARFPEGFDYLGDSVDDLPIWRAIGRAMLVGRAVSLAPRLRDEGVHILATIQHAPAAAPPSPAVSEG